MFEKSNANFRQGKLLEIKKDIEGTFPCFDLAFLGQSLLDLSIALSVHRCLCFFIFNKLIGLILRKFSSEKVAIITN